MSTREYAALVALLDEVYEATTTVVSGLDEESFDQRTRTELWSVKDLLFHQMCDAQRALVVFTTEPDGLADTTAVSYWSAWQPGQAGADAHARYAAKAAAAYRAWASAPACPGCHVDQYETAVVSAGWSGSVVNTTSARCASHIWWNSRSLTDQSSVRVLWSKDSSSSPDATVVVAS